MYFRLLSILLLLLLDPIAGWAQTSGFGQNVISETTADQLKTKPFKPTVNVSLGTSFTSFYGFSAFSTWVMPEITMPISNRWQVTVGMGYSGIYPNSNENSNFQNLNSQYGHLFVSGRYFVNQRVTLTGTAYKTMLLNPNPTDDFMRDGRLDFSNQGVMIDMNFKVTEQFQINVGFEYRQQNGPMYQRYSTGFDNNIPLNGFSTFP